MSKKLHTVQLPDQERALLHQYITTGVHSARSIRRAQILLAADRHRSDPWIAEHHKISKATVYNIRRRYCTEGLQAALHDKPRPGAPKKLDGRGEARFTAIACSDPPVGRQRWTVRLLADKLVELELVDSISPATVGSLLKKNELKPWQKRQWCIRTISSLFIMLMEDLLDLYEQPYDPRWPVICFDERPCQLLGDTLVPIPMKPGKCYKYDHHYERKGTCCLMVAVEPLTGFRFAQGYKQRTKKEYAAFMKALTELPRYANVAGFRLVQDNLNTHNASSFYRAFDPETARQLKRKFDYHYTPTNASWLNMAEIELSAISKQCLDRRIPTREMLEQEVLACVTERNNNAITITWQFTTNNARKKLKRHYEAIKN